MTNRKEYGHYFFLICIASVLFFNYCLSNDILSLTATSVSCIYLLVCKREYYVPSAIFLTSYALLFRYGDYIIFIFVCLIILLRGLLLNYKKFALFIFISAIYVLFHLLSTFSNSVDTSIGDYIPLFSILCLLAVCMNYNPQSKGDCIKHFLLGFFSSSIFGFWVKETRLNTILSMDYVSVTSSQNTIRFSGLSYDCNFYVLSAILVLYFLLFEDKYIFDGEKKITWYIMFVITSALGILTFSKSFILMFMILLAFAVFFSSKTIKKKFLLFVPISIIFILVMNNSLSALLNIILSRFDNAVTLDDLTTGRVNLWTIYTDKIFEDVSTFSIGYGIRGIDMKAAHNTYLEIISKFGLLGLLVDIIYLYVSNKVLSYNKDYTNTRNYFVCAILYLMLLFNLSAYTFYGLWVIIFFVLISKQGFAIKEVQNDQYCSAGLQCREIHR